MTTYTLTRSYPHMQIQTRRGSSRDLETAYEKPLVVPEPGDLDVSRHAWADARFATEILGEHAFMLAQLLSEQWAPHEKTEANRYHRELADLHCQIDSTPPPEPSYMPTFCQNFVSRVQPFCDYKARLAEMERSGRMKSFAWPLLLDHMRKEGEWYVQRLRSIEQGNVLFDRAQVIDFWAPLMDEDARFFAHWLDPDEMELAQKALESARAWRALERDTTGETLAATEKDPKGVMEARYEHPDIDMVLACALDTLEFQTQAARDIEAARIRTIMHPMLADHTRRETLKFVDELKRASE